VTIASLQNDTPDIHRLRCEIKGYDWGSTTAIAHLQRRPMSAQPEAELWIGTHPSGESTLADHPVGSTLRNVILTDPAQSLGPNIVSEYGPDLPFLLKVLAAERPLSLQVHPSKEQAAQRYAAQKNRSFSDTGRRLYSDAKHKPEILCALTPFRAVCGFCSPEQSALVFETLDTSSSRQVASILRTTAPDTEKLRQALTTILLKGIRVNEIVEACRVFRSVNTAHQTSTESVRHTPIVWCAELADRYPGDPAAVAVLLMNCLHLAPGQSIALPAGNLHAYLQGTGIEVM
jgi:mannose-6-phosphate isomerase